MGCRRVHGGGSSTQQRPWQFLSSEDRRKTWVFESEIKYLLNKCQYFVEGGDQFRLNCSSVSHILDVTYISITLPPSPTLDVLLGKAKDRQDSGEPSSEAVGRPTISRRVKLRESSEKRSKVLVQFIFRKDWTVLMKEKKVKSLQDQILRVGKKVGFIKKNPARCFFLVLLVFFGLYWAYWVFSIFDLFSSFF